MNKYNVCESNFEECMPGVAALVGAVEGHARVAQGEVTARVLTTDELAVIETA